MDNNSVNGKFTEDQLETAIIELFQAHEYPHVLGDSIHRRLKDILLIEDLRNFLMKPNWNGKGGTYFVKHPLANRRWKQTQSDHQIC